MNFTIIPRDPDFVGRPSLPAVAEAQAGNRALMLQTTDSSLRRDNPDKKHWDAKNAHRDYVQNDNG